MLINLRYLSFFFLFFTIVLFSCKKDFSTLGLDLQPGSDKIYGVTVDTATLKAYTTFEDSLSTDERTVSLLGSYTDPVFGRADASFLTQIRLSTTNVTFGTTPVADSIVLYLDYSSYYGDTNTLQNVSVYEIENNIYSDSTYYSNLNAQNYIQNNHLLANYSYYPHPNDTSIAIKLDSSLAQRFVNANPDSLVDNTLFINWFKGLYLKTQPILSSGAIIYFDLLSTRSKVTLYYQNDTVSNKFDFLINSSCARVNLFEHDYTTSTINSIIGDSLTSDSLIYMQAMSGLMSKINIPYLASLKNDSTIAIVRAELIIPVDNYDATFYKTPTKLLLVSYNSSGTYSFLPDYLVNSSYFGGTYYSSDNTYRFNISRYAQQLVDNSITNYGLALFVNDNRVSANRVILRGPKCKNNGMRLSITYLKP
ncbi:MAG: hypothetical protein A2X08_13975 [Bacteroidetes bacterium GWA2_32_17]|nr:MAG: hypothetical protein A2X08_13975 [Bacteroidetes bacterium GWA2_32_17]